MFKSSNIEICHWCHNEIDHGKDINYIISNRWNHPICSNYCYSRYSWKREILDKFVSGPKDRRCVTCNNEGDWFNFNGNTFCSGIHLDIFIEGRTKDLISRKKILDIEVAEISRKFLDIENEMKERFN
jgi:hypothetical protein